MMQVVYELPNESHSIVSFVPRRVAGTTPNPEFFDEDDGDICSDLSKKSKKSSANGKKIK